MGKYIYGALIILTIVATYVFVKDEVSENTVIMPKGTIRKHIECKDNSTGEVRIYPYGKLVKNVEQGEVSYEIWSESEDGNDIGVFNAECQESHFEVD